jgi:hypothetical protein
VRESTLTAVRPAAPWAPSRTLATASHVVASAGVDPFHVGPIVAELVVWPLVAVALVTGVGLVVRIVRAWRSLRPTLGHEIAHRLIEQAGDAVDEGATVVDLRSYSFVPNPFDRAGGPS